MRGVLTRHYAHTSLWCTRSPSPDPSRIKALTANRERFAWLTSRSLPLCTLRMLPTYACYCLTSSKYGQRIALYLIQAEKDNRLQGVPLCLEGEDILAHSRGGSHRCSVRSAHRVPQAKASDGENEVPTLAL